MKILWNHFDGYFDQNDPAELSQDLLAIELVDTIHIDVGWCPNGDPQGHFYICICQDDWDNRLEEPIHTRDLKTVESCVNDWIKKYGQTDETIKIT